MVPVANADASVTLMKSWLIYLHRGCSCVDVPEEEYSGLPDWVLEGAGPIVVPELNRKLWCSREWATGDT